MKIFVSGGTGLVGRHLIPALLELDHRIICLTRSRVRAGTLLPEEVEFVEANPLLSGTWQEAVAECDAVINLAGKSLADGRWAGKAKQMIRSSRLRTTTHLAEAIRLREQPCVLISASATGYYGSAGDRALDENEQAGHDFLARLAYEWERNALQAESDSCRVILLRIGVVLAREDGALPRLAAPFRLGIGGAIGNGRQYLPWIHVDDLVRIILFGLATTDLSGPVNAVVPTPPTQREFADTLARRLGRPGVFRLPAFLLRLVLGEKADLLLGSQRAMPNVLKARRFRFEYGDLDGALDDLLS